MCHTEEAGSSFETRFASLSAPQDDTERAGRLEVRFSAVPLLIYLSDRFREMNRRKEAAQ